MKVLLNKGFKKFLRVFTFSFKALKILCCTSLIKREKSQQRHSFQNQFGLSLIELCVALCVAGIIAGVGISQYGTQMQKAETQSLRDSVKIFVTALSSCIQSNTRWHISALKSDGTECEDNNKTCTDHIHHPCRVLVGKDGVTADKLKDKLREKLNYICPVSEENDDNKCETIVGTTDPAYFCLSIKKTISGTKHQIVALVDTSDTSKHEIYCDEGIATYVDLTASNCKKESTAYKAWNAGNDNEQCDWPVESNPTAAPAESTTTTTTTTTSTTGGGG